jgi:hypothetical protein
VIRGTFGRRTYSAGECSSTQSITQVRYKPAITDIRRDTVEGLNRRTSCIKRTYNSTCGRWDVRGSGSLLCAPREVRAHVRLGLTREASRRDQLTGTPTSFACSTCERQDCRFARRCSRRRGPVQPSLNVMAGEVDGLSGCTNSGIKVTRLFP